MRKLLHLFFIFIFLMHFPPIPLHNVKHVLNYMKTRDQLSTLCIPSTVKKPEMTEQGYPFFFMTLHQRRKPKFLLNFKQCSFSFKIESPFQHIQLWNELRNCKLIKTALLVHSCKSSLMISIISSLSKLVDCQNIFLFFISAFK